VRNLGRRLVPELVGDKQQLTNPGEDTAQGLSWGFLYAFTDLRDPHVTLSLEVGYLSLLANTVSPKRISQRPGGLPGRSWGSASLSVSAVPDGQSSRLRL
jgi:hypothetical protein